MVQKPVYLDNMASTRVDPRVLEAMLPYFGEQCGNPASRTHSFGQQAAQAVEEARSEVAALIGARSPREIIFTSGATEANNLAIKGVVQAHGERGNHVITCQVEHKAVLECCQALERQGVEVTRLKVDRYGRIDVDELRRALNERTILISLMAANNEIGTLQPLEAIGALAKEKGVLWHCDAAQAVGKIPLQVERLGVDLLSISGHKLYGPKGIGALYARARHPRVRLRPQMEGGGQERGWRPGTLNVPGIVGLGRACRVCREEMAQEGKRLLELRQSLYRQLIDRLDGVRLNGHPVERLPGNLNLSFAGIDGARLLVALRDLALSSGSACTSGEQSPSHVLRAIGLSDELAHASLRFGVGRFNTLEEMHYAAGRVAEEVERLRRLWPAA